MSTFSCHLSSIFITLPHNFHQLPFFASSTATNRVRRHLVLGVYDCVAPQPPNEADVIMMTYPATTYLSSNHCASRDASVIASVSRINNFFPFILFFFASSFLVSYGNANVRRRSGVSLPTSYRSSLSLLLLTPALRIRHCRHLHIHVSLSPMSPLSRISTTAIVCRLSPPLDHSPFPPYISTCCCKVSSYPPLTIPPTPPLIGMQMPELPECGT